MLRATERTPLVSARTAQARAAFLNRDQAASIMVHAQTSAVPDAEAHGGGAGGYLKAVIYGGLDGIITSFSTVTSVIGASLHPSIVLIIGIAHLFADGLSMGLADLLSSKAEHNYEASERAREEWELETNPEGEMEEMVQIYQAKGVSREDAEVIIKTLAKYPKVFLTHMMAEELGILSNKDGDNPLVSGAVTFGAFALFGALPLLPFLCALLLSTGASADTQLYWSVVLTLGALFLLGCVKAYLEDYSATLLRMLRGGLETSAVGGLAALIAYASGYYLAVAFPEAASVA